MQVVRLQREREKERENSMRVYFDNINLHVDYTSSEREQRFFVTRSLSRFKNYSCRSVCADNVLKRVIGIIVRMMPPRKNDAPRRAVMITRMHILRDIGYRRNCPWNMLRCVWVYEYEMRVGRCTWTANARMINILHPLSRCKRYADYVLHMIIYKHEKNLYELIRCGILAIDEISWFLTSDIGN